ncbi:phospholipase C type enzyme [Bachmanniomyces sp. S44760]|nr:phospholipase C type enzyme [Bachmanniomyces sp. S44760]
MVRYPLNGRPTAFFRGDWFVGKGVASARIRLGPGVKDVAEVFCTHLHAPYEQEPNDSYICHRTAQAWEIAKILRGAAERGHLAIGLGDFNMIPLSLAHQLITTHAPVEDVWRVLYPESSLGAAEDSVEKARGRSVPSARFNITQNGVTCDSIMNTWRWSPEHQKRLLRGENVSVDDKSLDPKAKRLDYIFTSSGTMQDMSWKVANVSVGLSQRHASLGCSLSDHFSVEATMIRTESERERNATRESNFLPIATYDEILQMISTYMTREQRQRRLRLAHFVGSVFVSIGCHIGIWWSKRNFVSFLLLLLSTLGLGAGVIDGMIGGLFIGSEIRALKEFRWEMEAVRGAAERFDTAKEA